MNIDAKKRRSQRIKQLNTAQKSWQDWREAPPRNQFIYKCLISVIIYGLIWTVFQLEQPYAHKTQQTIKAIMNESFDYAALNAWYQEHIGTMPSFLPAYNERRRSSIESEFTSPVSGQIVQGNSETSAILQLSTSTDRTVSSIGRGLVQYVGATNNKGMSVRILHTDGMEAIYGGLESVLVKRNDWLEEGELIGYTHILYFALKMGEQYVNPEDVIPFD